jgi:hypothetical protein
VNITRFHHNSPLTFQKIVQQIFTDDLCKEFKFQIFFSIKTFVHSFVLAKGAKTLSLFFFLKKKWTLNFGSFIGKYKKLMMEFGLARAQADQLGEERVTLLRQLAQAQVRGYCHSLLF